jgi:hypothetical protein
MRTSAQKYTDIHAEPEARFLPPLLEPHGPWSHVIVIPSLAEKGIEIKNIGSNLASIPSPPVLWIVVLNSNQQHEESIHRANLDCWEYFCKQPHFHQLQDRVGLLCEPDHHYLIVDCFQKPYRFANKQGVGLARKIGLDIGCALHQRGWIRSPWLATTDADVSLPTDYLSSLPTDAHQTAAMVYPFWHHTPSDSLQDTAMQLYELYLRYVVIGWSLAHPQYAYHSIGSTIAVAAWAYPLVHGVPKREAGEDFYLLNKLAKLGRIAQPNCGPIVLSNRLSKRVPFGTGRSVERISNQLANHEAIFWYDPTSFLAIGRLRQRMMKLTNCTQINPASLQEHMCLPAPEWPTLKRQQQVCNTLKSLDFFDKICELWLPTKVEQRSQRTTEWFDAFRALRLLHSLREHGYGEVTWSVALHNHSFLDSHFLESYEPVHLTKLRKMLQKMEPIRAGKGTELLTTLFHTCMVRIPPYDGHFVRYNIETKKSIT